MMNISLKPICLLTGFALCRLTHAAPVDAALLAVEPIDVPLPFYEAGPNRIRCARPEDTFFPIRMLLSRARYWAEDGHLDVLVQLAGEADTVTGTRLEGRLHDDAGTERGRFALEAPGPRFMLYPIIPETLLAGGEAALTLTWTRADGERLEETRPFRVERFAPDAPREGRVPLRLDNPDGVTLRGLPVTTGVPFPRGALTDTAHLRLVDEQGRTVPLQVLETARWSKFGSIKWVLCDFTVDLDGGPRELFLEYGNRASGVGRRESAPLAVGSAQLAVGEAAAVDGRRWASMSVDSTHVGFPAVDAGRLRVGSDGLWFDATGDGSFTRLLEGEALSGAFVEHEDGRVYRPDPATPFVIEEAGPEKIVIRRTGWYVAEAAPLAVGSWQLAVGSWQWAVDSGQEAVDSSRASGVGRRESSTGTRFCRYVTRYVIHRGSPLVRVFHTWIFTGDGNRDRIRNMGWAFPTAEGVTPGGFLSAFDDTGDWIAADALVQFDYDAVDLLRDGGVEPRPGLRAPGVARLEAPGAQLYFGVKDFWQHFPSELEFADGVFRFHNWPRHNRAAPERFAVDELTPELQLAFLQARFAHEGQVLDFRLPEVAGSESIWGPATGNGRAWQERHWDLGQPESVNAQGISRTEEFWLVAAPVPANDTRDRAVLAGLDAERLRVTIDPAWVTDSGAFYELHPRDPAGFGEAEAIYEQLCLAPSRWAERLGIYGMWVYGDLPAWQPRLANRTPDLYRAYRKRHHAWPYSWVPYARSGDSRLHKWVEASTRQMIDAAFLHHADDRVRALAGSERHRQTGNWTRSTLPWIGGRGPTVHSYECKIDYLLAAWYLTGYRPAWENVAAWAGETKRRALEPECWSIGGGVGYRTTVNLLKTFVETWEATFDPWFLAAAHAIADGHANLYRQDWNYSGLALYSGDREFLRFSGCLEARAQYLRYTDRRRGRAERDAFAALLTGGESYLRRAAAYVDPAQLHIYMGDTPEYLRGHPNEWSTGAAIFMGYFLHQFPNSLAAVARAAEPPIPWTAPFTLGLDAGTAVVLRKAPDAPLTLNLRERPPGAWTQTKAEDRTRWRLIGPDGAEALAGEWAPLEPMQVAVPAAAPPGRYRFMLDQEAAQRLLLPLTGRPYVPVRSHPWRSPGLPEPDRELPEVVVGAAALASIGAGTVFWFYVPQEVSDFKIVFEPTWTGFLIASIRDPDDRHAWSVHLPPGGQADAQARTAAIKVAPYQAGRLWRLAIPTGNRGFLMDPQIPPVYAIDPERWFNPLE